jgi:transcriptional regulator with XRE-family HTH domain
MKLTMSTITYIHASKQPRRPHFIDAWAEKRNLSQADLARELGADKSLVSRWFHGSTPGIEWQEKLAALFFVEREALFRDPTEDWLWRKLKSRTEDEKKKIINMIEAVFPDHQKDGTHD